MGRAQLRMRIAAKAFLAALLICMIATACAGRSKSVAAFDAGGVAVDVRVARAEGHAVLTVRFRPDRSGFHLYSKDLDPERVHGLGIATRVRLAAGLEPAGTQVASRETQELRVAELGVSVPVYPDGPVTISTPVRAEGSRRGRIEISYGACSDSVCLKPVINRPVTFTIPAALESPTSQR